MGLNELMNGLLKRDDSGDGEEGELEVAEAGELGTPASAVVEPAAEAVASGGPVLLVMSALTARRISPPLTAGDYMFHPGEAVEVGAADAAVLMAHEGLAARGVTFAPAPDGTPAPKRRKRGRACCGGRG